MIKNKYFIIKIPDQALDSMLKDTVGKSINNSRKSNDGKFAIVKLPIDSVTPKAFQNLTPYTHEEILTILSTDPNWIPQDPLI